VVRHRGLFNAQGAAETVVEGDDSPLFSVSRNSRPGMLGKTSGDRVPAHGSQHSTSLKLLFESNTV
jgi:hypothetical protein